MNLEDFIDIYDKLDSYVDPFLFPRYRDYSNAVAREFNNSVRGIMKDYIFEIWSDFWDDLDPDGSLRDFFNENT